MSFYGIPFSVLLGDLVFKESHSDRYVFQPTKKLPSLPEEGEAKENSK